MRLPCLPLLALSLIALLSGCATGDVKYVVPLAGGGQLSIPLNREGPPPGEGEGYRVIVGTLMPGKEEREAFYAFGLTTTKEPALRRIQVIDMSDEAPIPLVDDQQPQFTKGQWHGKSETLVANDPRLKFVYQITPSLRAYRFILTANDGHEISFYHIATFPPFLKAAMRSKWGEKY